MGEEGERILVGGPPGSGAIPPSISESSKDATLTASSQLVWVQIDAHIGCYHL